MARALLNKTTLHKEQAKLRRYRRYLPSLDLKRRQLLAEQKTARLALQRLMEARKALEEELRAQIPMLANESIDLEDLVRVEAVALSEEHRLGTVLPVLDSVELVARPYGFLAKPHWVDALTSHLRRLLEMELEAQVASRRVEILQHAVKRTTQRVHLFEKVLVPRARSLIKRIQLKLMDAASAAVVRAKLAKLKAGQGAPS